MSLTIEAAAACAQSVLDAGHQPGSLKYALWASKLSTQRSLDANGKLVSQLRPYVENALPTEPKDVLAILKNGHGFCNQSDAVSILWVEWADNQGLFDDFKTMPTTYAEWLAWRQGMYKLCTGHGFAWKTLSFAALLLWPTTCQLVPVDRHVLARFKLTFDKVDSWKLYNQVEQMVVDEWLAAGKPKSVGIWHWFKWSEWRQLTGDETVSDDCESHDLLSPYAY